MRVAIDHGYIGLDPMKDALRERNEERDDVYERAIEAASRQIDEFCGRQFWSEVTGTARVFLPTEPHVVWTGDFATDSGVTVELDTSGTGTWTPLEQIYWQAEPFVRRRGRPFDRITSTAGPCGGEFRWWGGRPSVKVTARWGWLAAPKEVEQACLMLAVDHYKAKDLTGGVAGFGDLGPVRIAAFNPQARALLLPFRDPLEP